MRPAVTEADLHLIVDGQVGGIRRSELLHRVGADASRQARLQRWQEQAEQLRTTFAGVLDEVVPLTLDPRTPACLQLVPKSIGGPAPVRRLPRSGTSVPWRSTRDTPGLFGATIGVALIVLGLGCAWTAGRLGPVVGSNALDTASTMAFQAVAALMPTARDGEILPTTTIPDLSALGFTLRGIEVERRAPASLVFRYRDEQGARASVSVASGAAGASPVMSGAIAWQVADKTVTVSGSLPPERLALIADLVRDAIR